MNAKKMIKALISREAYAGLSIFILLVSVAGMITAVSLFGAAFHNLDRGWNMIKMEAELGDDVQFIEFTNIQTVMFPTQIVTLGYEQYRRAFYSFGFAAFLFGYSVCSLILVTLKRGWK